MREILKTLIDKSVVRKFAAGSTILYQGEVPRSACMLISGVVRALSISPQGGEQTIVYHVADEIFPLPWIFGKSSSTLFFYEAATECEVALLEPKELRKHLNSNPMALKNLLDYLIVDHSASLMRINALEQPKAREKLLFTIYYLCQRYARQTDRQVQIPLTLTHQHIASLVGLTRETTATEMNRLRKEKIISYKNQKYSVDINALLGILGDESFRSLKINV